MNLLLKFESLSQRAEFESRLRTDHPEILESYLPASTLPHATVENIDQGQVISVHDSVKGLGRIFEDLQFEVFPSGKDEG